MRRKWHKPIGAEQDYQRTRTRDDVKEVFKCTWISTEDVEGEKAESRDQIRRQSDVQMENFRWNSPNESLASLNNRGAEVKYSWASVGLAHAPVLSHCPSRETTSMHRSGHELSLYTSKSRTLRININQHSVEPFNTGLMQPGIFQLYLHGRKASYSALVETANMILSAMRSTLPRRTHG